jgi:hypothetical protein
MPEVTRNFKDLVGGASTVSATPSRPPASSESRSGKTNLRVMPSRGNPNPEPLPPSPSIAKRFHGNQHTRHHGIALFFGLDKSLREASNVSGHPASDLERHIRRIGYWEWRRKSMGVAA